MNFHLGLDFGSTTTKMVLIEPEAAIISQPQAIFQYNTQPDPQDFYKALASFLQAERIPLTSIAQISATGTHANLVKDNILGIPTNIVSEVDAIGLGALALTSLDEALVVNMGTGTTYVLAQNGECRHLGGTGVGGGTLAGLAYCLLEGATVEKMIQMAQQGHLDKVDLLMRDVTDQVYPNLPMDLTAANFGKLGHSLYSTDTRKEDIALGIINMILQVIGSMAVMVCKSLHTKKVVFVGNLTRIPQIDSIYAQFSQIYNLEFIIPYYAVFATALGSTQIPKK